MLVGVLSIANIQTLDPCYVHLFQPSVPNSDITLSSAD